MKKIALSTLNAKYVHASLSPWCLRAGLEAFCTVKQETIIIDATINQDPEEILNQLTAEDFACYGFSCYIWNITQTKALAVALKALKPEIPIIFGGPEVSFHPEKLLADCSSVDFVLSGEGELPFAQLAEKILLEETDFTEILGLSYRIQGEIQKNPPFLTREVPPSPYCPAYFAQLSGKISYIESSRGCPFSCAFCLSGREDPVRYFPLERVKKELFSLANSGTRTIKFVDRTFNSSAKHCNEILSFLLEEYGKSLPKDVCFHFEMAGDILQESTLNLLAEMPQGFVQLEVGMQSFCAKTLDAVGRTTKITKLLENLVTLIGFKKQHLHIDLIAGLPYEDLEEFSNSFNIGYSLGADMLQLGFLKVLQGSEIGENPEKFPCDYNKEPPYQVISTPWLSESDFALLEKIEDAVDRLYNSGRFPQSLAYLEEATTLSPFALFQQIAEQCHFHARISLEDYIDEFYLKTSGLAGVQAETLRDMLVLDRVSSNSTGILPDSLKVADPRLRQLTIALEQNKDTARPPQGKRFVGILYSKNCGIYVDYPKKSAKGTIFPVVLVNLPEENSDIEAE